MAKNRAILISIIHVIVVLGQRNIGLRGNWDKELKRRMDIFILSSTGNQVLTMF